jgi:carbon-monoxide dehydrogenase large subunit
MAASAAQVRCHHAAPARLDNERVLCDHQPVSFLTSRTRAAAEGFGRPVRRVEDGRLVTGRGCFSADVDLPGQAYAAFVRSPHAHARIGRIVTGYALRVGGVIAVLTGAHADADGLGPIPHSPIPTNPHELKLRNRDGSEPFVAPHLPLATDRVRLVGEAVAMVIADTPAAARDGADAVGVEYEVLPAVVTVADATAPGAPRVWQEAGSNVCVESEAGDATATEAAFRRAAHVVAFETHVNRVTGVPMEPRAAVAVYDATAEHYTLYAGSGGSQRIKNDVAKVLGVPSGAVRVVARDVGGNYGPRNACYPEFPLVAWAARRVGRPVKWICERREALLTDFHARDLVSHAELALDADGNFLALRATNTSNVGAHAVSFIPLNKGMAVLPSVYAFPAAHVQGRAVHSHTSPTYPYRSAGRPEVMYVIERLIDLAARRHGFDRVALRRRNLIPSSAMPYASPVGLVYDSGDYAGAQERAVALADWKGFESRRAAARRRGRYRGIGISNYIELNTGAPRERAEITVRPEGRVDVVIGTLSAGQGHETSFAQLLVEWLGVEHSQVQLLTGDTDVARVGGGSHSGRSMRQAGVVMAEAAYRIVERGTRLAAWLLEAAAEDIEFARRRFSVKGTDRSVDLFEVAAAALRSDVPEGLGGALSGEGDRTDSTPSFPYGCAVCEVEVDPETGVVDVVRWTSVDDVGRAVNPMILHGQTHGGIAAGIGQALWELCHYDPETGQPTAATFMEYALPRADALPAFVTEISEVPSTSNPLGLRGGGEGGTTPALAAVVNAIVDALAELGVTHVEMPATPERVWQAIRAASGGPVS